MTLLQGLLFLFFGVGLILVDYQSLDRGWLPCGSNWLKGRLEVRRDDHPLAYWTLFLLYGAAGLWLIGFALRLLAGAAEPLPLR
jgi:hypothetical protein